jgi:hypothetical protein
MLLLAFLFPMATEPADVDPPEDATDDTDDAAGEDVAETADETSEDVAETDKPDPSERVKEVERIALEAQEQVRTLQRQATQRADPTLDEEERKLRDPATSELEKWQINSNRALRSSQQASQQALFQAQDMADKTGYQVKAASNPIYGKYEKRVEAELTKARNAGQNVGRELILAVLIGRDQLAGNFKPAAAKSGKVIARGKPTGARSDTPARSGMSDREKRAARLANVQI